MDIIKGITVTIEVKTCSIEKCNHPLLKKFIHSKYKDGIVIRDIAGTVIDGKIFLMMLLISFYLPLNIVNLNYNPNNM